MIARMKRALSEPIYFNVLETAVDCDKFDVVGSTGNNYIVSIEREKKSKCTCMDYTQRGKICKHIIAVLMKHYTLNIRQIQELDRNPYLGLNDVPQTSFGGDTNEECPICFQNIEQVEWVCECCSKQCHIECVSNWFSILRRQRMPPSCPMCRHAT